MAPTVRACGALVRRARARSERSGPPRVLLHSILPKSFPNLVPILISSGLLSLKRGLQSATGRVYGHFELFLFQVFRDRALTLPRRASLSPAVTSEGPTSSFSASVAAHHHHFQRTAHVVPPADQSEACLRARQPPPTQRCGPRGVARVTVFSAEGDDGWEAGGWEYGRRKRKRAPAVVDARVQPPRRGKAGAVGPGRERRQRRRRRRRRR